MASSGEAKMGAQGYCARTCRPGPVEEPAYSCLSQEEISRFPRFGDIPTTCCFRPASLCAVVPQPHRLIWWEEFGREELHLTAV